VVFWRKTPCGLAGDYQHFGRISFCTVIFQVLTAASMKKTVFWDIALCSLVQTALMMEAVSTSEISVNFYGTTRRNIPEDSHIHIRENLKSHQVRIDFLCVCISFRIDGSEKRLK
jgi:hypothetical protein